MRHMLKKFALALPVAGLGLASTANAGSTYEQALCTTSTSGSGYCYGNMLGFRNATAADTYAQFYVDDAGRRYFAARYTPSGATLSNLYTCSPDAAVTDMWQEAILHHGYFYISWNADGICNLLWLINGSDFTDF